MSVFHRQRTTVLVVEDDAPTRDLYRHALVTSGYDVVAVEDGLVALRTLDVARPAAVVLDLELPRVGGLDVYAEMRAAEDTRDIPVIIVTGSEIRELESDASRQFLRKPIHPDTLVAAVSQAIYRGRLSSESAE